MATIASDKPTKNIGINAEQVKTHDNASGYSVFEPIDENFKGYVLESIERIYATFLKRVADGRKMTTAQVDAIGQGRVWTGIDAHKLGLVDEIGGLDAAIKYAAKLGKTSSYRTENYPEYLSFLFTNKGLKCTDSICTVSSSTCGSSLESIVSIARKGRQRCNNILVLF
jgi:ClpP class serine protease